MKREAATARRTRRTVISTSPAETRRLGVWVGRHLKPGDAVCLTGMMGTGKTVFARGIAEGLGVSGGRGVRSPTFTIAHEYKGRHPIYHLDLYRLRGDEELDGIGWEEMLYGEGVTIIEAAEKMERKLPGERLDVVFTREGVTRRRLLLVGYGDRLQGLVRAVAQGRHR